MKAKGAVWPPLGALTTKGGSMTNTQIKTWLYRAYDAKGNLLGELRGYLTMGDNDASAFYAFEYHYGISPIRVERVKGSMKKAYQLTYHGQHQRPVHAESVGMFPPGRLV